MSADEQSKIIGVSIWDFSPFKFVKLGVVVVVVFGASFGPFIAMVIKTYKCMTLFKIVCGIKRHPSYHSPNWQ